MCGRGRNPLHARTAAAGLTCSPRRRAATRPSMPQLRQPPQHTADQTSPPRRRQPTGLACHSSASHPSTPQTKPARRSVASQPAWHATAPPATPAHRSCSTTSPPALHARDWSCVTRGAERASSRRLCTPQPHLHRLCTPRIVSSWRYSWSRDDIAAAPAIPPSSARLTTRCVRTCCGAHSGGPVRAQGVCGVTGAGIDGERMRCARRG